MQLPWTFSPGPVPQKAGATTRYFWPAYPGNGRTFTRERPFIALPGQAMGQKSFWPTVQALQDRGYEVYAIDAPAHGHSGGKIFTVKRYAEVLREVVETLRPDILIGHSAGGMAAVFMLQQAPQLPVARLVLLSVPSELELLMDTFRRMTYMGERVFKGMQRAFYRKYGWQMTDFSLGRFLRSVQIPGLLLHDRDDPVAPYAGALDMHRSWQNATLLSFDGLGHSLPGDTVIQAIVQYLDAAPGSIPETDPE